jgi:glycosyltransferase involved in cell wall biosynthesis
MARRAVYLHTARWTSLGLSLIEAMHLGMPVVALATTEAPEAVPPGTGVCSTDVDRLVRALAELAREPERARALGTAARAHALGRYGLDRFLTAWDAVLERATQSRRAPAATGGRR